jgi:hypothetical protein
MAVMVLTGALGGAGIAYMAASTVAPSSAGEGSGTVTVTTTSATGQVLSTTSPPFQTP